MFHEKDLHAFLKLFRCLPFGPIDAITDLHGMLKILRFLLKCRVVITTTAVFCSKQSAALTFLHCSQP